MIYYLVQAYKKEVDEQYQRHLYPSYLTSYKMKKGGDSFGLQSGMPDALKFLDEKTAEEWKEVAENTYPDREFEVVPIDGRILGRVPPRFVVTDNFVGIYGYSHENPPKCDAIHINQIAHDPKTIDEIKETVGRIRKTCDNISECADKIHQIKDDIAEKE